MNFTPPMCAAYCGNEPLIQELVSLGASAEHFDAHYRAALQIALSRSYQDPKFCQTRLPKIYHLLPTDSVSLNVGDQLIKIDNSRTEYFLLNMLLVFNTELLDSSPFGPVSAFTAMQLADMVSVYPDAIWASYRKKNTYLSSLLGRNEVKSKYTPNRKLFVRSRHVYYKLNPDIAMKTEQG